MNIKPGIYRHFKGNRYEVIGVANHSETMEPMVVYRALYGEQGLWVRPAAMWNEQVEREDYSGPRFTFIGEWLNLICGAMMMPLTKEVLMDLNAQLNQVAL